MEKTVLSFSNSFYINKSEIANLASDFWEYASS